MLGFVGNIIGGIAGKLIGSKGGGAIGTMMGSQASKNSLIDTAANAVDKLIYTKQEMAEDERAARNKAFEVTMDWISTTKGQNLARRWLAMMLSSIWAIQFVIGGLMNIVSVWVSNPILIENLHKTSELIAEQRSGMDGAMMLIIGFYFAAPSIMKFAPAAMKKFGGEK